MKNTIFNIVFERPIKDFCRLKVIFMILIVGFIMIFGTVVYNKHNRNMIVEKFEQFKKK